jgi:hypothetical protein
VEKDQTNKKTARVNKSALQMATLSMKPTSLLISIYTAPCPAVLQHSAHPFDAQTCSGEAQT